MAVEPARVRLGRVRCLTMSVKRMSTGEPLPDALCFVPKELKFEYLDAKEPLNVLEKAKDDSKVVGKLPTGKSTTFVCSGQPVFDSAGGWMLMTSPHSGWVLLHPFKKTLEGKLQVVGDSSGPKTWLEAVEQTYVLRISRQSQLTNCCDEEMKRLQTLPPGWSLEADEELAQFMIKYTQDGSEDRTGVSKGSQHFTSIEASSADEMIPDLMDSNLENFWESDGARGRHWLRFHMKPGTIIDKFSLIVDSDDESYLPRRVIVKGGTKGDLKELATHNFGMTDYDRKELQLFLSPQCVYYEIIEVHFKSCSEGGIDTRIHGISLTVHSADSVIMESEMLSEGEFDADRIARYPKLQPFESKQLFHRGIVLKRIASLLNEDFAHLLPRPRHGSSSKLDIITTIRQLWPLCKKRGNIIQQLLSDSTSKSPRSMPNVYINRIAALEHRSNPAKVTDYKNTVFTQVLYELKIHTKPLTYDFRWAGHWMQWWECKFAQEGVIDQGGGFRDTLADMAEELCPHDTDSVPALPLFIRSPNQSQDSSNVYRDTYVPNPSCDKYSWYQFVGQLMGAMFRSQETLPLSLPQFLWKQLVGDNVSWLRDFVSIDSAEVKLVSTIETMSHETFEESFSGALTFTAVNSNGETTSLIPNGEETLVTYGNRHDYCKLVKESRMKESKAQIDAIYKGLTKVIPAELLNLLTWQELEQKVCGNPEISVEALKKSSRYDSSLSDRVKILWQALEKFSNEDRSRFLRFITGRRRLPCTIYIDSDYSDGKLPTSATCSNTLYLPKYKNVDEAFDKLRYAAYNCIAIDTDRAPWE